MLIHSNSQSGFRVVKGIIYRKACAHEMLRALFEILCLFLANISVLSVSFADRLMRHTHDVNTIGL